MNFADGKGNNPYPSHNSILFNERNGVAVAVAETPTIQATGSVVAE